MTPAETEQERNQIYKSEGREDETSKPYWTWHTIIHNIRFNIKI